MNVFLADLGSEFIRAALLAIALLAGVFAGRALRVRKNKKEESI